MFKTQFITNETEGMKQFKSLNTYEVSSRRIAPELRKKTFSRIIGSFPYALNFHISKGGVHLPFTNQIYFMEHLPAKCDIVLPKAVNIHDWVVLLYDQQTVALQISREAGLRQDFKIYAEGKQRIMGLDEPLVCDMTFMSLRMTYLGDADGWVVS